MSIDTTIWSSYDIYGVYYTTNHSSNDFGRGWWYAGYCQGQYPSNGDTIHIGTVSFQSIDTCGTFTIAVDTARYASFIENRRDFTQNPHWENSLEGMKEFSSHSDYTWAPNWTPLFLEIQSVPPTYSAAFWFSWSEYDPNDIVDFIYLYPGSDITLYAWLSVDAPDWGWLGGFNFPIWFNEDVFNMTEMQITDDVWGAYMFHGVRWPGDSFGLYPGQAMWFASLCLAGCPQAVGTFYVGSATFNVIEYGSGYQILCIDTMMYPPSNFALIGDNTGSISVAPEWNAIYGATPSRSRETENKYRDYFLIRGPNPFTSKVFAEFGIEKRTWVKIYVYDAATGKLKEVLDWTGSRFDDTGAKDGDSELHSYNDIGLKDGMFDPGDVIKIQEDGKDISRGTYEVKIMYVPGQTFIFDAKVTVR
jgi:hypothetical protein